MKKDPPPSPDFWSRFLTSMPAASWVKDERFRFVYLNPAYEKRFGVSLKKIKGKTDFDLWPKKIAEVYRQNDEHVLSSGKAELSVEPHPFEGEGSTHWFVTKFVFADSSGKRYIGGQAFEATDSKKAEERVRLQASLLDQVRNAVIATDMTGKIIYWNRYAETLYQWRSDEVMGRSVLDVTVPARSKAQGKSVLQQIRRDSKGFWEGEFTVRRKDGTTFLAYVQNGVFNDESGRVAGFIGISVDITERKADLRTIEEKSIALKEILSQLEIEKRESQKRLAENVEKIILPLVMKMRKRAALHDTKGLWEYFDLLERSLQDLSGPGEMRIASQLSRLSLREIEICNLIRAARSSKEIGQILGISAATVETHRVRIRRKLGIGKIRVNLASHLQSL